LIAVLAASALSLGTAQAQERSAGASRLEIGLFPTGGMFFRHYAGNTPKFSDYALTAGLTLNVNKRIAVDGKVGGKVGIRQDRTHKGVLPANQQSPRMLAHSGDLIVYVIGSSRAFFPTSRWAVAG
jgi:hypothetical protein